jgi:hypothetical protein
MNGKRNYKKLLCTKQLMGNNCRYGDKCIYAHTRDEQVIDPIRRHIMSCMETEKYNMIDLKNEKQYVELLRYTNLCNGCVNNVCIGGNNCTNGISTKKYLICKNNLINVCKENCGRIHIRPQLKDIKKIRSFRYINTDDEQMPNTTDDDEINDEDIEIINELKKDLKNEKN